MPTLRLLERIACFPEAPGGKVSVTESEDKKTVVFENVAVLGLVSRNDGSDGKPRRYSREKTIAALGLYENAQVGIDHAGFFQGPSIDRLAGKLEGIYWDAAREKVIAKRLVMRRTSRTEHAIEMMMAQPEHLGLSHDVSAKESEPKPEGGASPELQIEKVHAVDVVRYPATNDGLYESADGEIALRFSEADGTTSGTTRSWRIADGGRTFLVLRGGADLNLEHLTTTMPDTKKTEAETALETRLAALEATAKETSDKLAASETARLAAEAALARLAVEKTLAESKLPDKAKERILAASASKTAEQIKTEIEAEGNYLRDLGLIKGGDAAPKAKPSAHGLPPERHAPTQDETTIEGELNDYVGSALLGLSGDSLAAFTGSKKEA